MHNAPCIKVSISILEFLQIYSINHKFRIRYLDKKLYISLNIVNRNGDYVKDLLDVILLIKTCIKNN